MLTEEQKKELKSITNALQSNFSGFPDPKVLLISRLKDSGITDAKSIAKISKKSLAYLAIKNEINMAKMMLGTVISQLPLLLVPISIPVALATLKIFLPNALQMLENIGVEPPLIVFDVIKAMKAAKQIQSAAAATLSAPPLTPLKKVLGLGK